MTAINRDLAAAVAATGIPLTADLAPQDTPPPTLRERMAALVAKQKQDAAVQRLQLLLAEQPHRHASPGEAAELRHLLYDADADATTPAFPYPTALEMP